MRLISATWFLFLSHLGTTMKSKRALLCFLIAMAPCLVAFVAPPDRVPGTEIVWYVGFVAVLQLATPLIGLIAGSSVLTEEIENRTLSFVFTRPVPRLALFLGRFLATAVMVSGMLVLGSLALVQVAKSHVDPPTAQMASDLALAAAIGGCSYALITGGLGVFVKRPMIVGLFFMIGLEGFLANVPGSGQKATLQYYLRAIFTRLGSRENETIREIEMIQSTEFLTQGDAVMRLLILIGFTIAICGYGIRRRQYVLTS